MRRKPLRDREYLLLTRLEIGLRKVSKSPRIVERLLVLARCEGYVAALFALRELRGMR